MEEREERQDTNICVEWPFNQPQQSKWQTMNGQMNEPNQPNKKSVGNYVICQWYS